MGRPKGPPTETRSIRLPATEWARLEGEAREAGTTLNPYVAKLLGVGTGPPAADPPPPAERKAKPRPKAPPPEPDLTHEAGNTYRPRGDTYPNWMRGKK